MDFKKFCDRLIQALLAEVRTSPGLRTYLEAELARRCPDDPVPLNK